MEKKEIKKCHKMDLKRFLKNYYGIENEKLLEQFSSLSHKDFKQISLLYGINIIRTNFKYITKDQLADGTIILVNDAFNNPAPYVNPNRLLSYDLELDTELNGYIDSVTEKVKFDKKGRQKSLKRKFKISKE